MRPRTASIDVDQRTITLYGVPIRVLEETEFLGSGADETGFDDLRPGQRVEVSCLVSDGAWTARKINTHDVKPSDKIKGTVTIAEPHSSASARVKVDASTVQKTTENSTSIDAAASGSFFPPGGSLSVPDSRRKSWGWQLKRVVRSLSPKSLPP